MWLHYLPEHTSLNFEQSDKGITKGQILAAALVREHRMQCTVQSVCRIVHTSSFWVSGRFIELCVIMQLIDT